MKILAKYGIGIYLFISILFKLNFLIPIAYTNYLFYAIMIIGFILIPYFLHNIFYQHHYNRFAILYFILLLNAFYWIFFDLSYESFLYIISKISTFNLIMLGILSNLDFYKKIFIKYLKYIMLIIVLLGYFYGNQDIGDQSGRIGLGFNPNDLGLFGVIGVLSVITFHKKWYKNIFEILMVVFFLVIGVISASRATLLGFMIVILLNYKLNIKTIFVTLILIIATFNLSKIGFNTAFDRITNSDNIFEDRNEVYEKGLLTLKDKFWFGNGLDKYAWTNSIFWDNPELAMGPHNAYLSIGIMYGIIFGTLFILAIFLFTVKNYRISIRNEDGFIKFSYYLIILTLILAFFESLIIGVNELLTIMFWFAIGVISFHRYKIKLIHV